MDDAAGLKLSAWMVDPTPAPLLVDVLELDEELLEEELDELLLELELELEPEPQVSPR